MDIATPGQFLVSVKIFQKRSLNAECQQFLATIASYGNRGTLQELSASIKFQKKLPFQQEFSA